MDESGSTELDRHLARVFSHDLRQPLNVLRLFSELNRRKHPDDEQICSAIDRAVEQLDGAFGRLSSYLLAEPASATPTDIREVWDTLAPDLTDGIDAPSGVVPLDASTLQRVLIELLHNARLHGRPPYHVRCSADSTGATIEVQDAGDGFEPAWLDEPRLSAPGRPTPVSVGLATLMRILTPVQGELRVALEPTIVTLSLPRAPAGAAGG